MTLRAAERKAPLERAVIVNRSCCNDTAAFKGKVALSAIKGDQTVAEIASALMSTGTRW
jgi:hypothetical protein